MVIEVLFNVIAAFLPFYWNCRQCPPPPQFPLI